MTDSAAGQWAGWLTKERDAHADDKGRARTISVLHQIRDRVLDGARVEPGETVVDLGAGTGLLAAEAAERVGPDGRVVAVDLSAPALSRIPAFIGRAAATLTALPLRPAFAHAVVARSVLVYVEDLDGAVAEAARILRPGGRLSLFEPVNRDRAHDAALPGFTQEQLDDLARAQASASETVRTMLAFTPDRLTRALAAAGFTDVRTDIDLNLQRLEGEAAAEAYLHQRGHAGAATPLEQAAALWGADGAARYRDAWLQAARDQGAITYRTPVLYCTATRRA
ncbi:class I SAM-dependent methyltransferase [Streptomyces ipomoeae]|uniref:class I SAM-dependent methyltransferase n=1 Tax=Streptomyces ipomoeae TaxID=103232 RepID=UPI00114666EC|nr:methyltransferase domain-containing protein [Streptomyces ipomoeae]TQE33182.1 methyltransferase domain-containing protein [Streptomyces ipomoeae]